MDVEGLARMIQEGAGRGGDMGGSEESQEVSRQSRSLSGNSRGGSRILGLLLWHLGGGGGGCSHEVIRRERRERCRELRRRGRSGPERSGEAEREDGGIVARSTGRGF